MTCTRNCWRSALKRGPDTGPSPVGGRKTGSNHHLICDGHGTALKVITTAANVNDVAQILALVDGIPPITGRPGWTLRRQCLRTASVQALRPRCAEWAVAPRRSWATTAAASRGRSARPPLFAAAHEPPGARLSARHPARTSWKRRTSGITICQPSERGRGSCDRHP
ncbi:transposase [Streptomyces mirabilis]|uniref:transposase n=1 Tax=Streptomyces mirabilis TaxID=68239 RepID=UPI0036DF9313